MGYQRGVNPVQPSFYPIPDTECRNPYFFVLMKIVGAFNRVERGFSPPEFISDVLLQGSAMNITLK